MECQKQSESRGKRKRGEVERYRLRWRPVPEMQRWSGTVGLQTLKTLSSSSTSPSAPSPPAALRWISSPTSPPKPLKNSGSSALVSTGFLFFSNFNPFFIIKMISFSFFFFLIFDEYDNDLQKSWITCWLQGMPVPPGHQGFHDSGW